MNGEVMTVREAKQSLYAAARTHVLLPSDHTLDKLNSAAVALVEAERTASTGKLVDSGRRSKLGQKVMIKHGMSRTPEHRAWSSMIERCYNPTNDEFRNYGGRGIKVADEWRGREGFANFFAYVGLRPEWAHALDRFPDRNGDYAPGNVRWATYTQNNRNRRGNKLISFRGKTLTLAEWCERLNLNSITIGRRLNSGWTAEQALTIPVSSSNGAIFGRWVKDKTAKLEQAAAAEKSKVST